MITARGLRARRVGEAQNPGPSSSASGGLGHAVPLKVWSLNLSSWNRHGRVLLEQATAEGVHLVAMQEVNLTQQGIPSASHAAAALGWQMLVLPKPHSRRGGVALLARQPLGLVELSRSQRKEAQSLSAHLLGLQAPLQVTTLYSVPGADSTLLYQETQRAEALPGSPWLVALDGNVPMESGPWAAAMQLAGGVLRAVGRHVSSRYAIDGLWSSEAVPALAGSVAERPREGDHTLVECAFDLRVPKGGSEWRLARTPEDKREAELLKDVSWQDVACSSRQWESLRTDLDAAWQQWCQDSQAWLSAAGALEDRVPERALGSEPRLRSGQHRVSACQSVQERRVRRLVRRLREAQLLQHRGRNVPSELQAALLRSPTGTVDLERTSAKVWCPSARCAGTVGGYP